MGLEGHNKTFKSQTARPTTKTPISYLTNKNAPKANKIGHNTVQKMPRKSVPNK